ncbi:MAG: DEAD/DEAH box helicase [Candidatus Wallbacteria bacterium]|nr:DEAD/DEAH box helicase [Candidatus Wallbacteria bacterium]
MRGFPDHDVDRFLDEIRRDDDFQKNLTSWKVLPAREAVTAPFPDNLDPRLVAAMKSRGIEQLFSHQAQAAALAAAGKNLVVVTPTASGKTLCYNLPVLNELLARPESRALYLFPTKALSADQLDELHGVVTSTGSDVKTFTFDGDTPADARRAIRSAGHIVVTNPDMLHSGILPHHTRWVKLFENLKFVVLDELHHYRGVFGSHLANVLRRLKRICKFYGSSPRFICCSATIANPGELASRLLEEEVAVVDQNGAPSGEKHFLLYNPPVVNRELGIRRSVIKQSCDVADRFLEKGCPTIVFARSRLTVEVLTTYLKERMSRRHKNPDLIQGYRGGYLPNERRAIEGALRDGTVMGVVSTNALELGIDIGSLEVSVMCGYPGTVASAWQQAGRAGRRQGRSVAVLIASSTPLDQYMVGHPDYFFGRPPEGAVLNPDNLVILMSHVKCAAFELPFEDGERFGGCREDLGELLHFLEEHRVLRHVGNRWHWMADVYPAGDVSLRSATTDNVVIHDLVNDRVIGEIDWASAPLIVHDEAIYLHQSRQYQIEKFDVEGKRAEARPVEVDYYTDAEAKTDIKVLDVFCEQAEPGGQRAHGEVAVTTLPVLYKKIRFHTHENVGWGYIHLPEQEMQTTSFWFSYGENDHQALGVTAEEMGLGLKALANILAQVAPLYVMAEPHDLRAVAMVQSPFTKRPTVYVYDNHPGGVGFSERIFDDCARLFRAAGELVGGCVCPDGCPSCVGPALEVGPRGKEIALRLLALGGMEERADSGVGG